MKLRKLSLMTILAAAIVATTCTTSDALATKPGKHSKADARPCPRNPDHWKDHLKHTSIQRIRLGQEIYSREEVIALLKMKDHGDLSIVLAQELIAAKINRLMGCDTTRIEPVCAHANALLKRAGRLPYKKFLPMPAAIKMYEDAAALELFNKSKLSSDCNK